MEKLLILLLLLLVIALIAVISHLYLMKRQIRTIIRQSTFIQENDTNLTITAQLPDKEINALIESINALLQNQRQITLKTQRASRMFKNSITGISHDLRTPLTSASGYLQMLKDYSLSPEDHTAYLTIVDNRIQTVRKLLDQLFEFARLEADELALTIEPVNLTNVLRDALSLFYQDFTQLNCEPVITIPDTPCMLQADSDALKRIFTNIISNALTHGKPPFTVTASVEANHCQIVFSNRSPDMTPEILEHIFDRFYTADLSRTRQTTGLGLSIARQLAVKMNGSVTASLSGDQFNIIVSF